MFAKPLRVRARRWPVLSPFAVTFWLALPLQTHAASFTLVEMATLAQGNPSVVRGPNLAGHAAGGGRLINGPRIAAKRQGLLFEATNALPIAGLPGSDFTTVFGLNDSGRLVGSANTGTAVRGFVADRTGAASELPPLPGEAASVAFGINNSAVAVGFSSGVAGERAVSWSSRGVPSALSTPAGRSSRALAVNDAGMVVGVSGSANARRAVSWTAAGAFQELRSLPGLGASEATGINNRGDIVGYCTNSADVRRATFWPAGGGPPLDMGTLPGGTASQAMGINDVGEVVGVSLTASGARAFFWTRSEGMQDLNALVTASGVVLTRAVGINNAGMIVALGRDAEVGGEHGHDHEMPIRVFLLRRTGG